MPAATYDFNIEKGTAFVISFQYLQDDGTAINLTNWAARLRWKEDQADPTIRTFITNTRNSNYEFTIQPLSGRIYLKIPAAQTAQYNFGLANYDLELQEPNDLYDGGGKKVFRILEGTINLIPRNIDDSDTFSGVFDQQDSCRNC